MDHLTSCNCSGLYTIAKELWTTLHHMTIVLKLISCGFAEIMWLLLGEIILVSLV